MFNFYSFQFIEGGGWGEVENFNSDSSPCHSICFRNDVDQIAADAEELASASPARAKNLELAMKKRMKALKMMIHNQPKTNGGSFEEEGKLAKVTADAKAMLRVLEEADLDDAAKEAAM
jgi:hypothetical protein